VSRSHHRWLHSQLPAWENGGLLGTEAAEELRRRHPLGEESPGLAQMIFGALGAMLVGTGLIAVIGYNWNDFGRGTRLMFAFLPLLLSQGFSAWVLVRGSRIPAWARETAGLLQVLAGGAAIAIVSQIYHLGGTWQDFLFWWILVSLPVLWAMRSHAVVIFHLLASAVWAGYQAAFTRPWPDTPFLFPLLLLALLPYWPGWPPQWRMSTTMRWAVTLASMIGFGACAVSAARPIVDKGYYNNFNSEAMIWMWLATAAVFVLVPLRRDAIAGGIGSKPQVILGTLWLLGFGISMTFADVAEACVAGIGGAMHTPWGWLLAVLLTVFSVLAWRARRIALLALAAIAILPGLALPFMRVGWENSSALLLSWLCTLYLAALGIVLIVLSLRGDRGAPRLGATLLAVLVITRMADSGFSLLTKGMGFILVGIAFLAFNLFLGRLVKKTTAARV
jgi:hypothetical protein